MATSRLLPLPRPGQGLLLITDMPLGTGTLARGIKDGPAGIGRVGLAVMRRTAVDAITGFHLRRVGGEALPVVATLVWRSEFGVLAALPDEAVVVAHCGVVCESLFGVFGGCLRVESMRLVALM